MSGAVDDECMSNVEFTLMKLALQTWRLKVRACLTDEGENECHRLTSHRECIIGKWIYSSGMTEHGQLRELRELERKHQQMHFMVKQVTDLKRLGRVQEAELEFQKVRDTADEVVALMDCVEKQVQ